MLSVLIYTLVNSHNITCSKLDIFFQLKRLNVWIRLTIFIWCYTLLLTLPQYFYLFSTYLLLDTWVILEFWLL